MKKKYIAIVGPTASGKSALAMQLARHLDAELINCDSVQFYRGFDIGAAKPSAEEQRLVPHHLWDILDWQQEYDARLFAEAAERSIDEIRGRSHLPIVVGGTGLYLRALWREAWHDLPKDEGLRAQFEALSTEELHSRLLILDPQRAAEIHHNDRFRLQRALEVATLLGHSIKDLPAAPNRRDEAFVIYVDCPRATLHQRIRERTKQMLEQGLVEEVERLLQRGVDPLCKPMQSIGYRESVLFLEQKLSQDELEEAIIIATRQYAKRQETWFRKLAADFEWQIDQDAKQLDHLLQQLGKF